MFFCYIFCLFILESTQQHKLVCINATLMQIWLLERLKYRLRKHEDSKKEGYIKDIIDGEVHDAEVQIHFCMF